MRLRTIALILTASTLLGGCALYPASWSPEQIATYEAQQAQIQQAQDQARANRTAAILGSISAQPAPQVQTVGQSNDTAVVYCRDLTGNVIACRKVN